MWHHNSVQERNGPICSHILSCKMDVWVYLVDVFQETLLPFSLNDHKNVIHKPLSNSGRAFSCVDGLILDILHVEVAHNGADGRPPSCYLELLIETAPELEIYFFMQNSIRLMICTTLIDVLRWSSWSSSYVLLMMLMAGSMGTVVKSDVTSYDTMFSLA